MILEKVWTLNDDALGVDEVDAWVEPVEVVLVDVVDEDNVDGAVPVGFLLELFFETERLLKHRESSAAALLVKLTSVVITGSVPPVAHFQAALKATKKQATK